MSVCASCHKPLVLEVYASDDEGDDVPMSSSGKAPAEQDFVPDDVHLNCGCHFHWDCLLEGYSVETCPSCSKSLTSTSMNGHQQILCTLSNEGGVQENLDILPLLTEEAYLKAYPDDRKARAFLEFCRVGDLSAVVEMLLDEDEDEDEDEEMEGQPSVGNKWLWYQDPIGDMQSGLHAAVQGGSREIAWLLLLMASKLDLSEFPAQVFQEAAAVGIMRPEEIEIQEHADIRALRDSQGKSAEDLAREAGPVWADWIGNGRLTA